MIIYSALNHFAWLNQFANGKNIITKNHFYLAFLFHQCLIMYRRSKKTARFVIVAGTFNNIKLTGELGC